MIEINYTKNMGGFILINRKIFLISVIIILIASISAISATEIQSNDTTVSKDQSTITTDYSKVNKDYSKVSKDQSTVTDDKIETTTKSVTKNKETNTKESSISDAIRNLNVVIDDALNYNITTNGKLVDGNSTYDIAITKSDSLSKLNGVIIQKDGNKTYSVSIGKNDKNVKNNKVVDGLLTVNKTHLTINSSFGLNRTLELNIPLPENKLPEVWGGFLDLNGTDNLALSYTGRDNVTNYITLKLLKTKNNVTVKVDPVKGVIGEKITLTAHVTDKSGNPVSGGNLVFKLNGRTLKTNGRFDSIALPQKFSIKNGTASVTLNADLYLRNAKNLTASYSGSTKYNGAKSNVVTAQIKKRNAKIIVKTNVKSQKQYEQIVFTVKLKDTTKGHKNKTAMSTNTKVLFKINGKTIKNILGRSKLVNVVNNTATYTYTVPAGMGGINNEKQIRNYTVEAVLISDTFYPDTRAKTYFNVQRSPITIDIVGVNVNKENKVSLLANIKDYKGRNVIGTNKVALKINGKTYINPKTNKAQYFTAKHGIIILYELQVPTDIKIKNVMLVTGERQPYFGQRNSTSTFLNLWPIL